MFCSEHWSALKNMRPRKAQAFRVWERLEMHTPGSAEHALAINDAINALNGAKGGYKRAENKTKEQLDAYARQSAATRKAEAEKKKNLK